MRDPASYEGKKQHCCAHCDASFDTVDEIINHSGTCSPPSAVEDEAFMRNLRDEFAKACIQGLLASPEPQVFFKTTSMSEIAWKMADLMIVKRGQYDV